MYARISYLNVNHLFTYLHLHCSFADLFLFRKQMEQIVQLHNVCLSRQQKYLPAVVSCYYLKNKLSFHLLFIAIRSSLYYNDIRWRAELASVCTENAINFIRFVLYLILESVLLIVIVCGPFFVKCIPLPAQ